MPEQNGWFTKNLKRERAIFESDTHSPRTTKSDESIIEQFETERQNFSESACPLLPKQSDGFDAWCNLLQESATSLVKRSRQHRSRRLRARTLLGNVFSKLGPEVFLLCTLATTISKLAETRREDFVTKLQIWWTKASHPQGLTQTANKICEDNSIATLVAQFINDAGAYNLYRTQ